MSTKMNIQPTMTIAVDFDGVIFELDGIGGVENVGKPVAGVAKSLRYLKYVLGYRIEIYTVRMNKEVNKGYSKTQLRRKIANFLLDYCIPFDGISLAKPYADFYIDDRAVRFKSWAGTVRFIKKRTK